MSDAIEDAALAGTPEPPLHLLERGEKSIKQDTVADVLLRGERGGRIRCPKCAWSPRRSDRWQCRCLHVWNTFETRALCPACGLQWRETQCLACFEFSLHGDWYERGHDSN